MANKEQMEEIYGKAPELDLSKIKNLKAAKSELSEEFSEKVVSETKKAKKNKFCFTEEHEIQLPTNGVLYRDAEDAGIRVGLVKIQPMSLVDEENLSNQSYIKNGTVFTKLLENCVLSNFDVRKFAPYDVYYLIYALRRITYGDDYEFDIPCPECGKKHRYSLDVSKVDFGEIDKNSTLKPIAENIKLPVSKYTVSIRYSQVGDEEEVYRLSKIPQNEDKGDTVLNYAARTIEILDDEGEPLLPKDYPDFYEALPGKDRVEISKHFKEIDELEIPSVSTVCPKCGNEFKFQIPFNKEFFRY